MNTITDERLLLEYKKTKKNKILDALFNVFKRDIDLLVNEYYGHSFNTDDIKSEAYIVFLYAVKKYCSIGKTTIPFRFYLWRCITYYINNYYIPFLNKEQGHVNYGCFICPNLNQGTKKEIEKLSDDLDKHRKESVLKMYKRTIARKK